MYKPLFSAVVHPSQTVLLSPLSRIQYEKKSTKHYLSLRDLTL